MAIVQNPIPGSMIGSIGNLTAYDRYNRHIIRSKPLSVSDAKTPRQISQRNVFEAVNLLGRNAAPLVDAGFKLTANPMGLTGLNFFTSINLRNGAYTKSIVPPFLPTVDPTKIQLSNGQLAPMLNGLIANSAALTFNVTWTDNSDPQNPLANAADQTWIFVLPESYVINPLQSQAIKPFWVWYSAAAARSTGTSTFALPAVFVGQTVEVYAFFVKWTFINPNGVISAVSDSVHIGQTVVV